MSEEFVFCKLLADRQSEDNPEFTPGCRWRLSIYDHDGPEFVEEYVPPGSVDNPNAVFSDETIEVGRIGLGIHEARWLRDALSDLIVFLESRG